MAVTFINSREAPFDPPTGLFDVASEVEMPAGAAEGDLVILHWAVTRVLGDAYFPLAMFGGGANLGGFTVTMFAGQAPMIGAGFGGDEARRGGMDFGIIGPATPTFLPVLVASGASQPLYEDLRVGVTVWRGARQAFGNSTHGVSASGSGSFATHTAPHSVLWISQFWTYVDGTGLFLSTGDRKLYTESLDLPPLTEGIQHHEPMVDLLTAGVSSPVGGWTVGDNDPERDGAWGSVTIGLSDVEPENPPPPPPPPHGGETCHFRWHIRWPDLARKLEETQVTDGSAGVTKELARILDDRMTELEDHIGAHWTCDCVCGGGGGSS